MWRSYMRIANSHQGDLWYAKAVLPIFTDGSFCGVRSLRAGATHHDRQYRYCELHRKHLLVSLKYRMDFPDCFFP